ncbi:hypothetical protein [Microvirga arsenatis]|uniref:Acyloxyacyl hydrolase n=1 Tax=Microvirga arsenatis TaxID=2692265 RepID=A0ABW9Z0Y9_9HYPH|nr:hypothetical protein [Microvirga arsenatis]NBJ10783.1 hypothetical protein [Microvirga arsenatis]NBJ24319.1 hypothetical protein [Microvirga arsenatis]
MVVPSAAFFRPANRRSRLRLASSLAGAAWLGLGLFGSPAASQGHQREWHLTAYGSQWVNADLLEIPERAVTGRLAAEPAYFMGAGLSRVIVPSFSIPLPGTDFAFHGNRIELEAQVLRHFGDQSHWEGTIALMFRTGRIPLFGGLSVNLAFGEGLSYASERPRLEGSFRVERSRFLNYLAFEAEFSHASLPGVYFVPRIHHRSGIFGLVAERESGSNFIGAGIRVDLR